LEARFVEILDLETRLAISRNASDDLAGFLPVRLSDIESVDTREAVQKDLGPAKLALRGKAGQKLKGDGRDNRVGLVEIDELAGPGGNRFLGRRGQQSRTPASPMVD